MKGFIENTIPQRQFENIKVRHVFESQEEKEEVMEQIIQDCIKYKDIVKRRIDASKPDRAIDKDNRKWQKIGDQWMVMNEISGMWENQNKGPK